MAFSHKQYYLDNRIKIRTNHKAYARTLQGRFSALTRGAKTRKIPMGLTFEQYVLVLDKGRCFYCSKDLAPTGSALDRQDHHKGYEFENVVPCCGRKGDPLSCNARKGRLEAAGFEYPRTVELLKELLGVV